MATKITEKKIDLPPTGDRNADPLTGAAGSHPIETGIGAAAAGVAAGMAVGAFTGPVGAAVGAAVGAVAGRYAGKGLGEMIDPTLDDEWLRDKFESRPYGEGGENFEDFESAYRFGGGVESRYGNSGFDSVVDEVEKDWAKSEGLPGLTWPRARGAVKDGYDRTVALRKMRGQDSCKPSSR